MQTYRGKTLLARLLDAICEVAAVVGIVVHMSGLVLECVGEDLHIDVSLQPVIELERYAVARVQDFIRKHNRRPLRLLELEASRGVLND